MNIFQLSISTIVFASTLLLGTTAVIASRFVITTVTSLTKPSAVTQSVVVPTAEPEQVAVFDNLRNDPHPVSGDFDPTGSYSLLMKDLPSDFEDVGSLDIKTREYSWETGTYQARPILPWGMLQSDLKAFYFTKISVGNSEIAFETTTQDDVSYQFVGFFPSVSEFITCQGCENPADIKGRLKKLKDGKVIAEMDAKFYAYGRFKSGN